jgi:hypothetical protein
VYDFYEFLARGIIAVRTGRTAEAIKYLSIAETIEPDNLRVWLWLATAVETYAEKRHCLERALQLDPNTLVAKVLLERLNQEESSTNHHPTDVVVFTCPSCAGKQHFDPDLLALVCEYCKRVEILTLANAFDAEIDLGPALSAGSGNWAVLDNRLSCSACGANVFVPADRSTQSCPFCDSDHILVTPATPDLVQPTAILPFEIHSGDVHELLRKWWNVQFMTLAHLLDIPYEAINFSPIYLPFWTFDGTVQIRCELDYQVDAEEYTDTERVIKIFDDNKLETTHKHWTWYECDIDDLLVYAAHSVPGETITQIGPFDLKSLLEYRPEMLAGWQAELYQVALEDAAVQAHKQMRDHAFNMAFRRLLFMEPNHMLQDDVRVLDRTYKLVLLPVWIIRYTFNNKHYQAFMNGQTGEIAGEKPLNWLAIGLAILAAVLVPVLGLLLYRQFGR